MIGLPNTSMKLIEISICWYMYIYVYFIIFLLWEWSIIALQNTGLCFYLYFMQKRTLWETVYLNEMWAWGAEVDGRGQGAVVWSFVGLCKNEVSHFADSEEKFSSYTQRKEKRLWGRIMLKLFFSYSAESAGKDRNHQQVTRSLNVWLLDRPQRWVKLDEDCARQRRALNSPSQEKQNRQKNIENQQMCDLWFRRIWKVY